MSSNLQRVKKNGRTLIDALVKNLVRLSCHQPSAAQQIAQCFASLLTLVALDCGARDDALEAEINGEALVSLFPLGDATRQTAVVFLFPC